MSLDPSQGQRTASPLSSGRSSPVNRPPRFHVEDETLKKDKAFRRYASGVDRALSLFDTALQEWADYISFLGRLLKALQAHPSDIRVVPFKAIVSKRLAQCLVPSLPSGVHQKALEVYTYIFELIDKDALSRDLSLYLPGLCPTLSFASLSVRPAFLSLFEEHVLKVDPSALRPASKAIILALLPGLEEEASEDFERLLRVIETFKSALNGVAHGQSDLAGGVDDAYFWQCFFLASITSPSRRQGALAFLSRNLPKLEESPFIKSVPLSNGSKNGTGVEMFSSPAVRAIITPEPGLLIRCFAAGLADSQILNQRGFLDLLVTHLPLHSPVLQNRVSSEDLEQLVTSAAGVVARREMSLNRRLWSWLLGPEPSQANETDSTPSSPASGRARGAISRGAVSSNESNYFRQFGLQPLVRGLLMMIEQKPASPVERVRPFRIGLSLMDRWEVGGAVVPEIFLPILSSVRQYESSAVSRDQFNEVLRSASFFFDGVESGLIWGELFDLTAKALSNDGLPLQQRLDKLGLVRFVVKNFNVREEEMLLVHMPIVALSVLMMLQGEYGEQPSALAVSEGEIAQINSIALDILEALISLVPSRAFLPELSADQTKLLTGQHHESELPNSRVFKNIKEFYDQQGNLDTSDPPFSARTIGGLLVREAVNFVIKFLESPASDWDFGVRTKLLVMLLKKLGGMEHEAIAELLSALKRRLSIAPSSKGSPPSFPFVSATVSVVCSLSASQTKFEVDSGPYELFPELVCHLWSHLSPSSPKYHVEAVRCLWQLQSHMKHDPHNIEASICTQMVEGNKPFRTQGSELGRRFAVLWTHSLLAHSSAQESSAPSHQDSVDASHHNGHASEVYFWENILTRPLFLLLDSLNEEASELSAFVRSWLQNLPSIERVFHLFVRKFLANALFQSSKDSSGIGIDKASILEESIDVENLTYYLQTLSNILRWSTDDTWSILAKKTVSNAEVAELDAADGGHWNSEMVLQTVFVKVCIKVLDWSPDSGLLRVQQRVPRLRRVNLLVLNQILLNPFAKALADLQLEGPLINRLVDSLEESDPFIQVALLDATLAALTLRPLRGTDSSDKIRRRDSSRDTIKSPRSSLSNDYTEKQPSIQTPALPPVQLVKALQAGLSSPRSRVVLDSWINFLAECLPLFAETIYQVLIPLVECLCAQIGATFDSLKVTYKEQRLDEVGGNVAPDSSLISFLTGIEQVLAKAHDRLMADESKSVHVKHPEQTQGFFGNMVSGVFASDTPQARSASANARLTVLLSFKDTIRICFAIWSWEGSGSSSVNQDSASLASFSYTSLRMRNRARRILEHLFSAESLECLETLVEVWCNLETSKSQNLATSVFSLLHVLDGSRPRNTIPAIFNAIYSRTNPNALDPLRKSTLSSNLAEVDVANFLVEYARSLEDDAMDEIWIDCMAFLRDVLANPFPQRHILPQLLEFLAILGEKVDNTNFGEQRKMRRELSDVFLKLLTGTFTTKPPNNSSQESLPPSSAGQTVGTNAQDQTRPHQPVSRSRDLGSILTRIVPNLPKILLESDRVLGATTIISTNVVGPMIRSKDFPENVSPNTLKLLYQLSRIPNSQKSWRRDVAEAFNDARFFSSPIHLVEGDWLRLLRQWTLSDKDRMPELLSRMAAPTTAGIMFGVGASSARLDADRKTQVNLRRLAFLVLAAAEDTFVANLSSIQEKLVELLGASAASSPSSITRSEVYMVLRALVLKTSAIHLAPLWPTINAELQSAVMSVFPSEHPSVYTNTSVLQACKLLDTLVVILPDEFQLHEWLFITDTIDAVYRPSDWNPTALIDDVSEELGATTIPSTIHPGSNTDASMHPALRKPLLGPDSGRSTAEGDLLSKVLKPFFSQLSIFAFESTYAMGAPDWQACFDNLLLDLFDDNTIVGS
ncbi:MAG: hypothetical protein M1837_003496 [Sclerophora amabilis]|nr:MAG: hypothetical protein M1837_003496 [Sclerophora amabilis]